MKGRVGARVGLTVHAHEKKRKKESNVVAVFLLNFTVNYISKCSLSRKRRERKGKTEKRKTRYPVLSTDLETPSSRLHVFH